MRRYEALALAIAGAFLNICVLHIEGGETSGTVLDSVRHSISKLAHLHACCTPAARDRLVAMAEDPGAVCMCKRYWAHVLRVAIGDCLGVLTAANWAFYLIHLQYITGSKLMNSSNIYIYININILSPLSMTYMYSLSMRNPDDR